MTLTLAEIAGLLNFDKPLTLKQVAAVKKLANKNRYIPYLMWKDIAAAAKPLLARAPFPPEFVHLVGPLHTPMTVLELNKSQYNLARLFKLFHTVAKYSLAYPNDYEIICKDYGPDIKLDDMLETVIEQANERFERARFIDLSWPGHTVPPRPDKSKEERQILQEYFGKLLHLDGPMVFRSDILAQRMLTTLPQKIKSLEELIIIKAHGVCVCLLDIEELLAIHSLLQIIPRFFDDDFDSVPDIDEIMLIISAFEANADIVSTAYLPTVEFLRKARKSSISLRDTTNIVTDLLMEQASSVTEADRSHKEPLTSLMNFKMRLEVLNSQALDLGKYPSRSRIKYAIELASQAYSIQMEMLYKHKSQLLCVEHIFKFAVKFNQLTSRQLASIRETLRLNFGPEHLQDTLTLMNSISNLINEIQAKREKFDAEQRTAGKAKMSSALQLFLEEHKFSNIHEYQPSEYSGGVGRCAGRSPIMKAILENESEIVRELIQLGVSLTTACDGYITPLGFAAHLGRYNICKIILSFNCPVDAIPERHAIGDWDGRSPLALACTPLIALRGSVADFSTKESSDKFCAKVMIEVGATICLLLDHGANIDLPDEDGASALFHAVYSSLYLTKILLERGVSLHTRDKDGDTSLQAVFRYHKPMLFYKSPYDSNAAHVLENTDERYAPDVDAVREVAAVLIQRCVRERLVRNRV